MRRLAAAAALLAVHAAPARAFTVAPDAVRPGARLTFTFAAPGAGRVLARVDLLAPGAPAVRARLGRVRAGVAQRIAWTPPALAPGAYTARLVLSRGASHAYQRVPLVVVVPGAPGIFPVQGTYGFGGPDGRFGALRGGHVHQGQDIAAAEGTPVVAPLAGAALHAAYQAAGAGYYVVEHATDGRDLVFMHLQAGSTLVTAGQPLAAGQPIASVGATGDAAGPHLHFEIWPDGWYSSPASAPVDPLPQLQAWAAAVTSPASAP